MVPPVHAASVQFSRTLEPGWRDVNHSLVHGGAFQVHAAPAASSGGETRAPAPKMPAWEMPLTRLLSAPLPAKPQGASISSRPTIVASTSGGWPSPTASERSNEGIPQTALRERVACTRELPENLRSECLERLDRLDKEIPFMLRHRPSWSHLKEPQLEDTEMVNSLPSSFCGPMASEMDIALEGERLDTSTAPAMPQLMLPLNFAASSQPLARKSLAQAKVHEGEKRRRRKLWTVNEHDLSTAASVWRSSAKGVATTWPSTTTSSVRSLGQMQHMSQQLSGSHSSPILRPSSSLLPPELGTERTRRAIQEAAAGVFQSGSSTSNNRSSQIAVTKGSAAPVMRGMHSEFRTTLRNALQF